MALTLAINAVGTALQLSNLIEIKTQTSLDDLPCRVTEIHETQAYGLPQFPKESGEYFGDTIYTMPLQVNARLYVEGYRVEKFESMIESMQKSEDFIEINSLNGKKYDNLKIESWERDTTSQMIGAYYYNVNFKRMVLVQGLSGLATKKGAMAKSESIGNKQPQEDSNASVLFKGGKWSGLL